MFLFKKNHRKRATKSLTRLLICTMLFGYSFMATAETTTLKVPNERINDTLEKVENQQANKKVSGTIVDINGETIIGASIIVKGTTNGTVTDMDGRFVLNVPENATLSISYLGYKEQELILKGNKNSLKIILEESSELLDEVTVVGYGVQKKETLTGAVSSVKTADLLASPNASIANSLAGKMPGVSTIQSSGQPGAEDPKIFVRGVGSLNESGASPLILVDGVERSFFQMDPNEIETVTVLKDASATAVFGVRGANGVILVTTRRGEKGKAQISISSSVGMQMPTRELDMADSYTYAQCYNQQEMNDGATTPTFDAYALERFRLGDDPMMYPDTDWRDYLTNTASVQTQHNLNISGGTDQVRYFVSLGYLFQDGLFKDFGVENLGYDYSRYNYRTNLDIDVTKSTILKLGLGGVIGDKNQPMSSTLWDEIGWSQPFSSPGVVDGKVYATQPDKFASIKMINPIDDYYGKGYKQYISNTMNLDATVTQKLDVITKGLSLEVKGAYNTSYSFTKERQGYTEIYTPYYQSEIEDPNMAIGDPGYNKDVVYMISGSNKKMGYKESTGRGRDWYFETSTRYNRKFGDHSVSGLILYNQSKRYYPSSYGWIPSAYIGLVGRATYNYKSRYMAEFNVGYNGSENFAPDKRFGTFPAFSTGWIISEEKFMKNQHIFNYFKLRASIGKVGNDNMSKNRFLYLPDSYNVNKQGTDSKWKDTNWGYNFGLDNSTILGGAVEKRLGNPDVTWETAVKQNYGMDVHFLDSRLKISAEYFRENRKDILLNRQTIPILSGLTSGFLPAVNLGEVDNHGYEIDVKWRDAINENFSYFVEGNISRSKNKIVSQDEIEPNEPYMWRTGQQVGAVFGYVANGFYNESDFDESGNLIKGEGFVDPKYGVKPGDVIYEDLNGDGIVDPDDQKMIGYSTRPGYVMGLNMGFEYKNFHFSMNWSGAAERSLQMGHHFTTPFMGEGRSLLQMHADECWTPETANTATLPRMSAAAKDYNSRNSTLWVRDGSYLKLKNVTIGYNFKDLAGLKKLGIKQLGVKITGYNVLTFDSFDIMDPESNPKWQQDTYPVVQIYNLGLNLTF